jgi:hypothetical protein
MSEIRYRLAKPSDAKEIAALHWHVRDKYSQGIFLSLGQRFLTEIYKILLNDAWEVVVCAVNENGKIIGFASTSLNIGHQFAQMKKHRLRLGFFALRGVLFKPSLAKGLWERYKSLGEHGHVSFVHTEGVRGEYWCWQKDDESLKSIEMSNVKNNILYDLGVREMFFEVDKFNKAVYKYHLKVNKAEPIEEINLPDGRIRVLMRKVLVKK